jgi:hypothetical protein
MQVIPNTYSHAGRVFERIKRNDVAVIYRCTDGRVGYEVHRIRIAEETEYMGKLLPRREILATGSEWGKCGWSYLLSDYKGALKRFNSISEHVNYTDAGVTEDAKHI